MNGLISRDTTGGVILLAQATPLPPIIAGPIIRHTTSTEMSIWMLTRESYQWDCVVKDEYDSIHFNAPLSDAQVTSVQVGKQAYVVLVTITFSPALSAGTRYSYDLLPSSPTTPKQSLGQLIPGLVYPGRKLPNFVFSQQLSNVLHGSCRKPHDTSADGLIQIDRLLSAAQQDMTKQPDLLMMSGDQVYIDDVAGPMLVAIHQVIERLGLYHESLPIEDIYDSKQLLTHDNCYYRRGELLPDNESNETLLSVFFGAKKKPIFTSVNANNHLISFAEVMAMYALVWSPELWPAINLSAPSIDDELISTYEQEKRTILAFSQGLSKVRRALAHLPVYMIFDDHDVTDDWNLTRGWEQAVYNHPFAKRIVGNALMGYWLCQGWGNRPDLIEPLTKRIPSHFSDTGIKQHDKLIDHLLNWNCWHYSLATQPKLVVLDTRTQRWRSESSLVKPSGLMDWEALCDLQQELIGQPSVILVSAAPVFGVKLIETTQKIFTFFGKALMVDAENWMAHRGTASVMLNIFRHHKTPPHFVILSGDVHYSFVYDVTLRFRRNSPQITQITSSGIKNQFPEKLLRWFDKLNRILYSPKSPLNWFTQRRNMTIVHRRPEGHSVSTLLNQSGLGIVKLDPDCQHVDASTINAQTGEVLRFIERN